MKTLVLLLWLACLSQADIKCDLKSGTVDSAYNKVGDAALKGIKFHDDRNKGNMRLFECTCDDDDDLFEDDYVDDIEYEQGDSTDWFRAEIFRIHGCKTLRLSLKSGRDTLADYFSQKLLIVEQIESLELEDFEVGELPGSTNFGTFSSIYFRDLKFTENLDQFKFEDRHEVVFERVKIGSNVEKVDIFMDNIYPSIENVLRIEECEFPGVNDVTSSSDIGRDVFKLDIIQEQPEMDGEDEKCNYDYKGDIIVKRNTFGYLRKENFKIIGGKSFQFEQNSLEVINDLVFDLRNLKNVHINGNNMGFSLKSPNGLLFLDQNRQACEEDELDLPESQIGEIQIKLNKFAQAASSFMEIDKEPNYSKDFIKNNVFIVGNEVSQKCNCTKIELPKKDDDDDDEDSSSTEDDNARVRDMFINSSRCLSDQLPPLFGERKDICDGKNPTTFEQLKINTEEGTRGRWTIYLVVAIFITMLLTFCCTFAIMYFMCMKDKDRTSISPEP